MNTTPLAAHRAALHTTIAAPLGLAERRRVSARPLTRNARALDESTLGRIARECEGVAVVGYYGHPSRRMAIAYPLAGWDGLERTRGHVRLAVGDVRGHVSCGNYVFHINH